MRRPIALAATALISLAVAVPAVQLVSSSAAQAIEAGSLGAAAASSWQSNATVWKMTYASASGDIFMVGDFTSLRPPGDAAGTGEVPATYFAALKASTGALDTAVAHTHTFTGQAAGSLPLTGGVVAASPDGSVVYVGGAFTTVDGSKRNHVAAFSATTGALLPWNPNVNGKVSAIAAAGSTVYLGGTFTKVGSGAAVGANLAAVSASTGAVVPWGSAVQPGTDGTVDALDATADDTQVVVGGYFDQVDGLTQSADGTTPYNKAAIIGGVSSATPGALEPMPADSVVPVGTTANNTGCVSNVKDVVISGGAVYLADEGTGGGCFDGTWSANLNDGSLKWVNRCLGATQTIEVVGNYLYKGSHAHDCQSENTNGDPSNYPQVPENQARHLLSESLSNGFLGPWYPFSNAGPNLGPRAMATDGTQLYVGGDFTTMNHTGQQGIARFTSTSDFTTPQPAQPVAVASGAGSINVYAQAPVDLDDPDLTLQLFRDGGTTPIASTTVNSLFWKQPVVGWADTGLTVGGSHTYTVKALETNGTGGSVLSPASARVTVGNGSSGYAAQVLADNPAAYWRFDEAKGTIGADSSPNLLGGSYTGGVTLGTAGGTNDGDTAATFDGSTGYFSSGASEPSPTTFSAEAWIKTTSTSGGKIIGFGNAQTGDSSNYDKQIYMTNDGHLIFGTYNGGTDIAESTHTYNDGQWHQIVGTQGSNGMALYVDGAKVASNPVTTNQNFVGYWRVGDDNLNSWPSQPASEFFGGAIDDVSVYNSALTPGAIATQYTAAGYSLPVAPGSTDLYAKTINANSPNLYWRLDDPSGSTTATDLSGNGNGGTYNTGDTLGVAGAIHDGTSPADTAMTTDGQDDGRMVGTTELPSPSTFSIEAWFKTTTPAGKIIGFGNSSSASGSSNYDKHIYFNGDGSLSFGVWNGEEDIVTAPASMNLDNGQWHYVVATQDSSGMKLFVDGAQVASNGVTTNQSYDGYWHVGGDTSWGNGNDFNGSVDEVAVYSYALSSSQVLNDYQVGSGTSSGPTPPAAPATPTVTSSSSTTADVSWAAVAGATKYQVQRAVHGSGTFSTVGSNVTALTFHDSGLTPGQSYDYQVIATNAGGNSSPSPTASVTTVPGQPGVLTATAVSPTEVDLRLGGLNRRDIVRGVEWCGRNWQPDQRPGAGIRYIVQGHRAHRRTGCGLHRRTKRQRWLGSPVQLGHRHQPAGRCDRLDGARCLYERDRPVLEQRGWSGDVPGREIPFGHLDVDRAQQHHDGHELPGHVGQLGDQL